MKKMTLLLLALLLMGATAAKAQSEQKDFDDKYATELVTNEQLKSLCSFK